MIGKKILLYYCFLFAAFVTLSGIAMSKTPQQLSLQFIFLPVSGYFVYTIIKDLKDRAQKKHEREDKKSKEEKRIFSVTKVSIFVAVIFLTLLATSALRVFKLMQFGSDKATKVSSPIQTSLLTPIIPSLKPEPQDAKDKLYVIIQTDDEHSLVNIREYPSVSARIIKKTTYHQKYPVAGEEGKWYKIVLEDGSSGYVNKELTVTSSAKMEEK